MSSSNSYTGNPVRRLDHWPCQQLLLIGRLSKQSFRACGYRVYSYYMKHLNWLWEGLHLRSSLSSFSFFCIFLFSNKLLHNIKCVPGLILDFEDTLTIKALGGAYGALPPLVTVGTLGGAHDEPLYLEPLTSPVGLSARSGDSGLSAKYWSLEKINSEILAVMFKICPLFLNVSFINSCNLLSFKNIVSKYKASFEKILPFYMYFFWPASMLSVLNVCLVPRKVRRGRQISRTGVNREFGAATGCWE